jgi:hypothetical protein
MRISPLNFKGLMDNITSPRPMRIDPADKSDRAKPEQVWLCPECDDVHKSYDDAVDCCADLDSYEAPEFVACPVCTRGFKDSDASPAYRFAADCCLWKDLDAPTRWRIADAVEAGSTWAEELLDPAHRRLTN